MAQDDRFDLARLERLERRLQALEDGSNPQPEGTLCRLV